MENSLKYKSSSIGIYYFPAINDMVLTYNIFSYLLMRNQLKLNVSEFFFVGRSLVAVLKRMGVHTVEVACFMNFIKNEEILTKHANQKA